MALTSDEVNFLIYRYLRESGFEHSAYAFGHESFIYKSSLESSSLAPGALISFVQKGLQYSEIEAHMSEDGTEIVCDEGFSLMKKHVCKAKPLKRKIFNAFDALDTDYGGLEIDNALMLRQPMDPQRGDHLGSTGLKHMAVSVAWHPFVPSETASGGAGRNNKRGSSASSAAQEQMQNTLLTANADGSVKVWQYLEEEDERKDTEADAAAAAASSSAAAAASTIKVPFQKGYFCIRTFEQPPLPAAPAAAAASASSPAVADTPDVTAPVSALAAAADAVSTTAAAPSASSSMEDTPEATAAAATAAAAAAASTAASSSSDAAASSPAPAAASSSSAPAASSAEESNKRQRLNDSTAVPTTGAAAAADSSSSSSAAAAAASPAAASSSSCSIDQNRSIVAMDWHPKGHTIACGSYTGAVYLWSLKGVLLHSLLAHTAPITALAFNKSGTLLLTGSVDHRLIVWDTESGARKQTWELHSGPVLDLEWCPVFVSTSSSKNKDSAALASTHPDNQFLFASCSTDGNIWVVDVRQDPPAPAAAAAAAAAEGSLTNSAATTASSSSSATASVASLAAGLGAGSPPRCLRGHEGEVNQISWDPSGRMLLSASDDCTAKIWSASTGDIVHDLVEHAKEVLVARWSGTGPCTDFHKHPLFVATGSVDTSVKLWDPLSGQCLHTLSQHTHPVSQLAFAPKQQLLATASHERVFLWSLTSGTLLRTFKNLGDPLLQTPNHVPLGMMGGLNALAFDNKGEQLAISYADGMSYVLDLTEKNAWEEQGRTGL